MPYLNYNFHLIRYSSKIQQIGNNNSNNVVENFIEQRAIFDKLQRDGSVKEITFSKIKLTFGFFFFYSLLLSSFNVIMRSLYIERLVTETKKIFHKNGYLDMLIDPKNPDF